jgi:peptidoglycan/LPS O-acetylase OafA/YrhL
MPPGTDSVAAAPSLELAPVRARAHAHALRDDIQWLRGLSVLAVLLYHADKALLPGGYLGVDVFFVLSGFLITRNIFPDIERGTFSYGDFIARRFRRLLPACYAMLAFTAALSGMLLTRADFLEVIKQMAGTLTFSANIVLWQQAGYFDTSSALKPLLHTWSLSLEEQYYLVLPLLLWLGGRRRPVALLVTALLASLIACLVLLPLKPGATFFLLPFRAWELLAGSVCALLSLKHRPPAIPGTIKLTALTVLIATLAFPPGAPHPGIGALIVVLATAVLMLGAIDFGTRAPARAMIFLGDISYSLYLAHWPLFAVANHVYAEAVPIPVKALLCAAALILATLSWRFVEQPFRTAHGMARQRTFLLAGGAGATLLLAALLPHALRPAAPGPVQPAFSPNYGLDRACAADKTFAALPVCQWSPAPSEPPAVLLWGDSYAMHLAQGMQAQSGFGFVQATKSLCGPVPGTAPLAGTFRTAWASNCLSFNDSVLRYLDEHPEIRVVVLGSKWRQFFTPDGIDGFMVRDDAGAVSRTDAALGPAFVGERVRSLIEGVVARGRKLVLVLPPPSASFDIRRCQARRSEELPFVGAPEDCQIDRAASAARDATLTRVLDTVGQEAGAVVFSLEPYLCTGDRCATSIDGTALYQDEGHFSAQGSALVGERFGLNRIITMLLRTDADAKGNR